MKIYKNRLAITLLIALTYISTAFCALPPRVSLWGLTGSGATIGRIDALLPLIANTNTLAYSDFQGRKDTNSEEGMASLGFGIRNIPSCHSPIYGGYIFLDYNHSDEGNSYWFLSPGAESLGLLYDLRINGYFPIKNKRNQSAPFFASGLNDCGNNGDCQFVEFHGHQQFEHGFVQFEEVGPGVDGEIGRRFPVLNNMQVFAGAYYFSFEDSDDIKGVEGRIEIPLEPRLALTAEASYDNQEHTRLVAGIRLNLGESPCKRFRYYPIQARMRDSIPRNLGAIADGMGVPVATGTKDDGLFLIRDDIFFFTATGGSVFDGTLNSGTFENPLAGDQFTQATIDTIDGSLAANANFYFNPGTYTLQPPPNGRIALNGGQSIFGRSADYRCSAVGDERALFIGGFDLFEGDNTLASFQLTNEVVTEGDNTGIQSIVGIDIDNAENIFICNANIAVSAIVTGDNTDIGVGSGVSINNTAIGVRVGDDSEVVIHDSTFSVLASIGGNNEAGTAQGSTSGGR